MNVIKLSVRSYYPKKDEYETNIYLVGVVRHVYPYLKFWILSLSSRLQVI